MPRRLPVNNKNFQDICVMGKIRADKVQAVLDQCTVLLEILLSETKGDLTPEEAYSRYHTEVMNLAYISSRVVE